MTDTAIKTIEHVRPFLNGVGAIAVSIESRAVRYAWIQTLVGRFHYHQLGKAEKGLLLDFLQTGSGSSRIQGKRVSHHYLQPGQLQRRQRPVQGFRRLYTLADIRVLAQTDAWHGTLSGPATKKRCERAWTHFGQRHGVPPAGGHFGGLLVYSAAQHPHPTGHREYLRVDTVHQGDFDGVKGATLSMPSMR